MADRPQYLVCLPDRSVVCMVDKFVRYMLVGVLNTAFGYLIYSALIYLGLHYSVAVLISTVLGVLFNFKTIGTLVFKSHNNALIFRFISVYILTYFLNVGGLKIFSMYHYNMYLAGLYMIIPMAVISFLLHNRFVFGEGLVKCR